LERRSKSSSIRRTYISSFASRH